MGKALEEFSEKVDGPMLIVTTVAGGERSGCLVGYWTKCSVRPPRFAVCISKKNHTFGVAMAAETLALHLIPKNEVELARLFGSETGDEIDKFSRCGWSEGRGGVPILDDCPTHAICRIVDRTDVGDHVALVTEPVEVTDGPEDDIFTHNMAREQRIEPGHPA
ncbi:MAG TPA: flavin reductase family protein [Actinomycetota bacterium]|nr:flavin reductase family protein [Actinomycetota bacterium]